MTDLEKSLNGWVKKVKKFESQANKILARSDSSIKSRVFEIRTTLKKLNSLPIDIQEYFKESIRCLENGLNRSAIVLAWSGFFYLFAEKLYADYLIELKKQRPKWNLTDFETFRESYTEHAIIEAGKVVGFINNSTKKELIGMLSKRNQCAHPTLYKPRTNISLGYVDDIFDKLTKVL